MDFKNKKCVLCCIFSALVIVGGINWGLVGVGGFLKTNLNLVNLAFGKWPTIEWIVYILVGVSAIVTLFTKKCKKCEKCETCQVPEQTNSSSI
ncbi:MAG: DUF378 domain-containing protein [Candidatus Paceibacterota bacterium]|jgi:hypothetical protein